MGDMRADKAAMVEDWAAGGERADARMRANALKGLNATVPDWERKAEALGLDADLMLWTEAQWTAVIGTAVAA